MATWNHGIFEKDDVKHRLPPYELYLRKASTKMKNIVVALCCPSEFDDKILLLKMLHSLIAKHKEIKLELSEKFPSCWLCFIVLDGTMQDADRDVNQ